VLHPYGFEKYLEEKSKLKLAQQTEQEQRAAEEKKKKPSVNSYRTKAQRSADAMRRNRMRELEQEIENLEILIAEQEEKLVLPEICTDYQKMQEVCAELESLKNQSESCFMELCQLEEA
ncbi:MAG: ABC transporter, partial [Oscillospiraceae bacterium]|nr:ABC transporter [Oscillospiraceae bacterium]